MNTQERTTAVREPYDETIRNEARKHLSTIKPGETIFWILRKRSRTNETRKIDLVRFVNMGTNGIRPQWLTYWAAALFDNKIPSPQRADNGEGIRTSETGDELVQRLSYFLFGDYSSLRAENL